MIIVLCTWPFRNSLLVIELADTRDCRCWVKHKKTGRTYDSTMEIMPELDECSRCARICWLWTRWRRAVQKHCASVGCYRRSLPRRYQTPLNHGCSSCYRSPHDVVRTAAGRWALENSSSPPRVNDRDVLCSAVRRKWRFFITKKKKKFNF